MVKAASFLGVVALAAALPLAFGIDCNNWSMRYKKFLDGVCVCNSTVACDTFPNDYLKISSGQAGVYRTTRDGERFRYETATFVSGSAADADLTIDATTTYQTIIGFGGAFTDAAAINVYKMNSATQKMILDAYYSADGIQYTTGRIPISSTDFSTSIYSYDATVDDFDMSDFSIAVDKTSATHKLDLIHRVLAMTERNLSIFASSWAPPVWMTKENTTLNCHMKGSPGEQYWKALALYYSEFITAYEKEGIPIWAMTTQNEPSEPLIKLNSWQSLRFTTTTERDFIKKDLGPQLKADHPNLKLIIMDDNKSNLLSWLAALEDAEAAQYVDGVGIHWYSDADFPLGIGGSFSDLTTFHSKYPNVFMLGTEACEGYIPDWVVTSTGAGVKLGDFNIGWWRAHNYAKDIINDLTSYVSGWTDWNLVLDTNGGPNWAENYVDAPIIVDETNGNEIYKQPMYYVMGHFSKFLTPGSVRLKFTAASGSKSRLSDVDWTAFLTPEGKYVAILFNKGDDEETVKIMAPSGKLVQVVIRPTSIQTVVFNNYKPHWPAYCSPRSKSQLQAALASLLLASQQVAASCNNWSTRYQTNLKGVCVCNATQCDTVSNTYTSLKTGLVGVYTTSKAGDRFAYKVVSVDSTAVSSPTYSIDVSTQYQTMIGFGGAFTDAAAINVYKLSSTLQQMVLDQYFSETGLQYTLGRVPIGSTDFSTSIYSYNDVVDDFEMEHFSIAVDKSPSSHKVDLIQRALNTSSRDIKLFASSWAPPAWMTTKNTTINCSLKGSPGEEYWEALALYYSKFFDAYSEEGIDFWAMTVQNEPSSSILQTSEWQSLRLTTDQERDFVKLDLGPMMAKNHPDLKIIAGDDQKSGILDRLAPFEDADALKYISGLGVHWYRDLDFFFFSLGGDFDKLLSFYEDYPDIFMLATEACEGYLPSWLGTGSGVSLTDSDTSWSRAENYGHDIIEDINNYVAGWTDWNLALDTTGGPNWAKNYVDAPILVDEKNGAEFYKQPMFYIMGHFSKFIPAGSKRIEFPKTETLSSFHRCAFVTPDNRVVIQFMNRDNSAVTVSVKQTDSKTFTLSLPAHSMQTVILPPSETTKIF